jgi:twitching motility protein PilT
MTNPDSHTPATPVDVDELMVCAGGNGQLHGGPSHALRKLLHAAVELQASDLHLVAGYPATFRVHGKLKNPTSDILSADDVQDMVLSMVPERAQFQFETGQDFDCSLALVHEGQPCRFRANIFLSQGSWCACLRNIPDQIPTLDWLGFPDDLAHRLVSHKNGLVVITGVTGSGKSATLAALISLIRSEQDRRILTIEEPIEYVHNPGSGGVVTQREVGRDVESFAHGLKYGLRQDPDVILVGEIRDRETAQIALTAAETGHLILTTLHTRDAKGAVSRVVDLFPQDSHDDIRKQVAMSLRSVVCQHLLPSATEDEKRVLALEVLHVNQQVQVAIRNGKIEQIESALQTGRREGMMQFDDHLQSLVKDGRITADVARRHANDPERILGGSSSQRVTTMRAF